jgi:methanogenic corrinoid protein MtbC1
MLRAQGLEVKDLGIGVHADALVRLVQAHNIKILLISTLMFPSALRIARVREQLERADYAVRIIVGGAPFRFDDQLWRQVGADAMGRTAADAITLTRQFAM